MAHDRHALTVREAAVLRLVARGWRNRAIGGALSITEGTVKGHLRRILRKLHVTNRTEAALLHRKLEAGVRPSVDVDR